MPTHTCLCCGHTETFETAEEAFDASWDVAPYFTLQPLCDFCVCAGPDPRTRRSETAARRRARQLEETRTSDATQRTHREGAESGPELRTILRENCATSKARSLTTFAGKVSPLEARFHRAAQPASSSARPDRDTDMWGVSDPAERPWDRVCDAEAGSLTPLLCCDTCTRALAGRHKTPPGSNDGDRAKRPADNALGAPVLSLTRLHRRASKTDTATARGGQPRPQVASPSSAPSCDDRPEITDSQPQSLPCRSSRFGSAESEKNCIDAMPALSRAIAASRSCSGRSSSSTTRRARAPSRERQVWGWPKHPAEIHSVNLPSHSAVPRLQSLVRRIANDLRKRARVDDGQSIPTATSRQQSDEPTRVVFRLGLGPSGSRSEVHERGRECTHRASRIVVLAHPTRGRPHTPYQRKKMRTTQPFDPNFGASRSKTLCGSPVREVFDHVLDSIVHGTRTSAKDGRSSAEVSASG